MRRTLLKGLILSGLILILSAQCIYAVSYDTSIVECREGSSSSSSSEGIISINYNQVFTLQDVEVKLTQDDDHYIFHITANTNKFNYIKEIGASNSNYYDIPTPFLYKLANFGKGLKIDESKKIGFIDYVGSCYSRATVYMSNNCLLQYHNEDYIYSNGGWSQVTRFSDNNGDKYYIPLSARPYYAAQSYPYRDASKYPFLAENNGEGVELINNTSYNSYETQTDEGSKETYIQKVSFSINCKISIEKTEINSYRYICFGSSQAGKLESRSTGYYYGVGYSFSTNTLDLKNYITCEHNWLVTESDVTNHKIKCVNCEWEKTEAHDFKFEYDGIKNDVCVCSRVNQVKYHYEINDDYNTNVDKVLNANATCDKIEVQKKTGYNFKWYEKYELQFDDDNLFSLSTNKISATKVFLNNTTSIDSTTGSRSIYYKAVYSPIKYIFNYSSKASTRDYISKQLNKKISPQTFYYNSRDYLKDYSEYDYLTFKGWTLTEGSSNVDFSSKAEIFNYTSIDLSEFTIYPIYEPMEYKILYNTISGKYDGETQQMSKVYDYYIAEDFLKPKDMGKNKTFSHYVDMNGNEFTDMNALRNFIKDDAGDGQTIILFAMSKTVEGKVDDENTDANTTPQNYWDLNNKDEGKSDADDSNTGFDGGGISDNDRNDNVDNGNGSDTASNDSNNSNSNSNNADARDSNNGTDSNSANGNNDKNEDDSTNEIGDIRENNSSNNSNTNNNTNNSSSSYKFYSSGGGGDGGSNNSPLRIKSFPEDKYTGPGVVSNFTDAIKAEAVISDSLTNSSLYLYNVKQETNEFKNKKTSMKNEKEEDNENDDEVTKEIFGPPLIDFEDKINYRGLHGPWYYEKEYVDRILKEREEQVKENESEEELSLKEKQKENRLKNVIIVIFGFIFILLILIFEVFNIRQMKKN